MDLSKSLRLAVDSGKVVFGIKSALKTALNGGAKVIVISVNCPPENASDLRRYCALSKTPLLEFGGTSIDFGTVCGKPFPVSALTVIEEGNSDILKAVK